LILTLPSKQTDTLGERLIMYHRKRDIFGWQA
jgi:hypothetical protein